MRRNNRAVGLLLVGAGQRVLVAFFIIALLWAGFLWATASPGAL